MNHPSHMGEERLSTSAVLRIDEICDRAEKAWQAGQRPRLEDCLGDVSEPEHSLLFRELLRLELAYRCEDHLRAIATSACPAISKSPIHGVREDSLGLSPAQALPWTVCWGRPCAWRVTHAVGRHPG
jgi:hypothetical protein